MPPRADWEKHTADPTKKDEAKINPLDDEDIQILRTYGQGPYAKRLKEAENDIKEVQKRVNEKMGVKELATGLAPPNLWDLAADKQRMGEEHPLQVARCTKILKLDENAPPPALAPGQKPNADEQDKYVINVKQIAKFVVALGDRVAPTDIEEGMRVGVDRTDYKIMIPLPPKIDASVTMMQVEDKPDVTYQDVGGCKEQIDKLREVVETPLLTPEKFADLGIDPPKGVMLYGPPGTGKTLCARAVANRTDATFIRVIGSELVQKYVGEGARMVRELFEMARSKKACIIFFDEIDAIGGARHDDGQGGDNEVQRTMLELINQLDGFDARGNIKVLMATNRPDTLDPALLRPGRIDRKIEFKAPDQEGRAHILRIHARSMAVEPKIRFDLIARLCPNATGAELRSVATEAGMFAIRERRRVATEKDFLLAVEKVIRAGSKFSSTGLYAQYQPALRTAARLVPRRTFVPVQHPPTTRRHRSTSRRQHHERACAVRARPTTRGARRPCLVLRPPVRGPILSPHPRRSRPYLSPVPRARPPRPLVRPDLDLLLALVRGRRRRRAPPRAPQLPHQATRDGRARPAPRLPVPPLLAVRGRLWGRPRVRQLGLEPSPIMSERRRRHGMAGARLWVGRRACPAAAPAPRVRHAAPRIRLVRPGQGRISRLPRHFADEPHRAALARHLHAAARAATVGASSACLPSRRTPRARRLQGDQLGTCRARRLRPSGTPDLVRRLRARRRRRRPRPARQARAVRAAARVGRTPGRLVALEPFRRRVGPALLERGAVPHPARGRPPSRAGRRRLVRQGVRRRAQRRPAQHARFALARRLGGRRRRARRHDRARDRPARAPAVAPPRRGARRRGGPRARARVVRARGRHARVAERAAAARGGGGRRRQREPGELRRSRSAGRRRRQEVEGFSSSVLGRVQGGAVARGGRGAVGRRPSEVSSPLSL